MEEVSFIHIEKGDDLIVSFAIAGPEPMEIKSLNAQEIPFIAMLLLYIRINY